MSFVITPALLRAARGLAGVSQAELAEGAGIAERTVAAIEAGENKPSRSTNMRIASALPQIGVELVAEGEGRGAGVRLLEPDGGAVIIRRDVLRVGEELGVVLRFDGRPMTARVAVAALTADGDTDAALARFDLRRVTVANAIARKLRAEDHDADGHIRIRPTDLDSAAVTAFGI